MRDEGLAVVGGSLRGSGGRRVQYWPATGRALSDLADTLSREEPLQDGLTAIPLSALADRLGLALRLIPQPAVARPETGDLILFD